MVTIYNDGAYSPLLDQGGIGVVYTKDGKEVSRYSRGYKGVTNNKMELFAVIVALILIREPLDAVEICTDSQYVIGCATLGWKRKKNTTLWAAFDRILEGRQKLVATPITFNWVKGHSDNKFNNICDEIAVAASKELL